MTLKIEVTVPQEAIDAKGAVAYLTEAMAAIGFSRGVSLHMPQDMPKHEAAAERPAPVEDEQNEGLADVGPNYAAMKALHDATEAPKRERGQPAPGRKRRTKEEIAEDEAAPNISTGEDRIDPAQITDTPEVAAQDAADEAAEVEQHRDPAKPLTLDDVKAVVSKYVARFGMAAVQEDGPKIFVEALGAPPEGNAYWKMSLLPAEQEKFARVVDVWEKAVKLNPLKRDVVGA